VQTCKRAYSRKVYIKPCQFKIPQVSELKQILHHGAFQGSRMFLWQLQFLSLGLSTCPAISSLCILSEHKFLFYLKVKGSCPGISIFPMRVVKHWPRLPREAVAAPSLAGLKARLDGVLSNLVWWKTSLLMAGGLEPDDL